MRMILTLALLMTSTIIFGATSNNELNQTSYTINYMETLAVEAEMPELIVEERNSAEVVTVEGDESAKETKEIKKTTDKQAGSQAPKQDYEILKRSQRILEVKYKLYA